MAANELDPTATEALVLEHLPDVATLCNRMFRQQSDADDAVNEAVIAILRALPSYRAEGPFRHWVLKVALNAARQHRRGLTRTTRRETTLPDDGLPGAEMPHPAESREEQESLRAAIAALPDDVRETVTLYYFHALTQVEIADLTECSQKTVHVRVRKGLDLLARRLAGSPALGAMAAVGGTGAAVLDSVSPAVVAAAKQAIAAHFVTAAAAGAAAAGQTAAASSLTTTGIATGGIVMNAKLAAGAALLAVTCLVGGAALSSAVLGREAEREHAAQVAELQRRIDDGQHELHSLQGELSTANRRNAARVADLDRELAALREQAAARESELAALRARVPEAAAASGGTDAAESREERWKEIRATMSGVLSVLQKMQEEGANQFELGPQVVAELGKLSAEDFAAIADFDAGETDPQVVAEIRDVMLQALIFVPKAAPHRDEFMARYVERARSGAFGESFTAGALRRITFRMPPFVDAYRKIVAPLGDDLKREFVDLALQRAADGATPSQRIDGVAFLARTDDPRATRQLTDVFRQTANSTNLRVAAVRGLSERADEDVLRLLRDAEGTEQDEQVLAAVRAAAAQVEKRVAAQR